MPPDAPRTAQDGRSGSGMDAGWVRAWLDHNHVIYRETVRNGLPWLNVESCPWHPDEDPYRCGPAELSGGMAVWHGMHDRCKTKTWRDFREAAGIELDGKPKNAGKSTLLALLIRAMLDGEPFQGTPTARTSVVLLTEQSAGTMRVLLERAGLTGRDDLHIVLWHETREMAWPDVVEQAADLCREVAARLLVVDTLPQFAGLAGDMENDSGAALAAMRPIQAAAASGLAVILSRHDRKGGGDVGESARGSSAFAGAVDVSSSCDGAMARAARPSATCTRCPGSTRPLTSWSSS